MWLMGEHEIVFTGDPHVDVAERRPLRWIPIHKATAVRRDEGPVLTVQALGMEAMSAAHSQLAEEHDGELADSHDGLLALQRLCTGLALKKSNHPDGLVGDAAVRALDHTSRPSLFTYVMEISSPVARFLAELEGADEEDAPSGASKSGDAG